MAITGWLPGSGAFGGSYIFSGDPGMEAYRNSTNPFIANNPYLQGLYGPATGGPGGPRTGPPQVPGQITGAPGYGGSLAAGSIPRVPRLGKSMQQAISQNVNNLPAITGLAGNINQFNLGQVTRQFEQGLPGYQERIGQESANIGAALRGELPPDVRNQILRNAAEFGISTGTGASRGDDLARTLSGSMALYNVGRTSLEEQQRGSNLLSQALSRIPRTAIFDPASQFITPAQQQAANLQANIFASLPDPEAAYQRARADAAAGLGTGFGLGRFNAGGGGGGGYSPSSFNLPTFGGIPTGAPPGPTPTPTPTTVPSGPGWGYTVTRDAQGNIIGGASSGLPGGFGPYLPPSTFGIDLPASASGNYLPASTGGMYDYLYA